MPNKLSNFWQELKRRKVVRVITVYAAATFVILELVDIIAPNLGLPAWTFNLVLILICVGFIITVIVSWVYDATPEGIVKTEPAHKVKKEDIPTTSKSWKIASYISFVVIVVLIILNIIPRTSRSEVKEIRDKSIAVLPLEYLSANPENEYLANGVLDAITGHLSLIKGLRVMPRTSIEQYRENKKTAKEIGEELDVSYLVEGSFQMVDNQVKLIIQLVIAEEGDHIFFKEYDRNYSDIFTVQSEVAQTIAKEIEVAITPEEQQRIEKVPTKNLTAYDFYQKARENQWLYWLDSDTLALNRAEDLYYKALENDPTFAQAYNGLAFVYWKKQGPAEYLSEKYLDSLLVLTDRALSYNRNLYESYLIRGIYYAYRNNIDQAILEVDKALKLNPNEWMAYYYKAKLYQLIDNRRSIENYYKAINLNRGQGLSLILSDLSGSYFSNGFEAQGKRYLQQYIDLTGDSALYYRMSVYTSNSREEKITILKKSYRLDSSNREIIYSIGENYSFLGMHEESLKYFEKCLQSGNLGPNRYHRIGYAYWNTGNKEKADYYFDKQIEYCLADINLGRLQAGIYLTYYDLAGVYAFRGEKSKAYENLRVFNQKKIMPVWVVDYLRSDPLFDSIRDEPEFQQILADVEAKYQAEHERVRQWLEANEMF